MKIKEIYYADSIDTTPDNLERYQGWNFLDMLDVFDLIASYYGDETMFWLQVHKLDFMINIQSNQHYWPMSATPFLVVTDDSFNTFNGASEPRLFTQIINDMSTGEFSAKILQRPQAFRNGSLDSGDAEHAQVILRANYQPSKKERKFFRSKFTNTTPPEVYLGVLLHMPYRDASTIFRAEVAITIEGTIQKMSFPHMEGL